MDLFFIIIMVGSGSNLGAKIPDPKHFLSVMNIQDQGTPDTRKFGQDLIRCLVTQQIRRRVTQNGIQDYVRTKARCYLGRYSKTGSS